ncbi:MAG: DedA family protein [Lactobacillaceae bacterium]|jgi:membrane protein DedA with SNARE-associated domain|nr:DedA family protein [Lactobacillaceae bacterium]
MLLANYLPAWVEHLLNANAEYQLTLYLILFGLIFIETAGIVMGFIPGDTLLIATGSIAGANHSFKDLFLLIIIFGFASLAGDVVNYFFGAWLVRQLSRIKVLDRHLNGPIVQRLQESFHTKRWLLFIVTGRFLPFIRVAVPLMAHRLGLAFVDYIRMAAVASFLWSISLVSLGYFFGKLELPHGINFILLFFVLIIVGVVISRPKVREKIISLFLRDDRK